MKNILFVLLFISTTIFAQQNDKNWEKVIDFENEGKTKSANELVEKIYKDAVSNKNEAEMIKCFFYHSKYLLVIEENAQNKILNNLKTEIYCVSIPSKAILNLIYAKCLNYYYTQGISEIQKRTNTNIVSGDFLTWTSINFRDEINSALKQSLENELVLKNTPLSKYDQIFNYSSSEELKNENLFDYIIKENIAIYSSKFSYFALDQEIVNKYKKDLLGNSADFTKLNLDFINFDDLRHVLSLYQKQETINPKPENQWDRIVLFKNGLNIKTEEYLNIINRFQKTVKDDLLIQKIQFEKASILAQEASKTLKPDYNSKAVALLDSILKLNNRSTAYKLALQKKSVITSKSLKVQLQRYTYNNQNARAFLSYKNVDQLKISFYKISYNQLLEFKEGNLDKDSIVNSIISKKQPSYTKDYSLLNKKDYFEYSTEILLPNLNTGSYLAYFESDSDIKNTKAYTYQTVTSSNISVLASNEDKGEKYQVLDRKTGKTISNAIIKISDYKIRTNNNGIAVYHPKNEKFRRNILEIFTSNDSIIIKPESINYNAIFSNKNDDDYDDYYLQGKVEFYLDRAIYRPGQIVYYKGIAIQKKKNKTSIVANTSFKITVNDPSYNTFKEFEVTTNEFGSFSGELLLPKIGLTGTFTMRAEESTNSDKDIIYNKKKVDHPFWDHVRLENSYTDFRVEEYKRPKFEVVFEPKKETFQLNQSIKVKGTATAFAGSSISDAKVSYTITRYTSYWTNNYSEEDNKNIIIGETKTDNNGKFAIDFIALPSENSSKEDLPIFNYIIKATVTDINGETHESQTNVKVGYHDLVLEATIKREIETKDKNEITLKSTNLNDEFLAAKGEIKIYFVNPLSNKFKRRVWQKPEIQSITNEDFEKLFPYEQNELDNIENEILVYSKKVDTENDKKIALDFISDYQSGNYKIVFSAKDSFDNIIETKANFKLKQSKDKFNPSTLFSAEQINEDPKKDGFILIKLTSVIPNIYVSTTGNYNGMIFYEKMIHLENNETTVKIPLKKEFDQILKIGFQSIFDNEVFSKDIDVILKSITPKLDFTVETFRSKIQPGSTENWIFNLKSNDTKNEAEVLASMYDISLDQFATRNWYTLSINNYHYNGSNKKSALGFDETSANLMYLNLPLNRIDLSNEGIKLMSFGFDFIYRNDFYTRRRYQLELAKKANKPINAKVISGIVTDDSELPLPGVSVVVKGTTRGTQTDFDGYYEIQALGKEQLDFSYIGMKTQSIKIANRNFIDVILTNDSSTLEQVVVTTAYGIQKKANLSAAITTVSSNVIYEEDNTVYDINSVNKKALEELNQVKARKNLSETAFFLPNLKTDSQGKVSFSFTSPEALTAWKLRLFAHNKEAVSGYLQKNVVTQKELMLLPNFPRFFREKDTIVITTKISNITAEAKTGIAALQLFDAVTMEPIDAKMLNADNIKNFTIPAYGNTIASWTVTIPEGLQGVQYKIVAKSGDFSDGEENIIPVLTNNMLVTESIPIWVRENSTKEYTFENLKNNNSTTLKNHQFTFEYTSNPAWIAIQSLPYLMEYEHECAEQTFARFYSNALATEVISSNPKIAVVFDEWRKKGKINPKLEENEKLKSIILAETPWLNDNQNEDEKRKSLAVLFDLEKMKTSQEATFEKLKKKQNSYGSFSWFEGGTGDDYITRHILAGLGHLSKLVKNQNLKIDEITKSAIPFIDGKFLQEHQKRAKFNKETNSLIWRWPYSNLHYLYSRSFYLEQYSLSDTLKKVTKLYLETAKKDWLNYSIYEKGLTALVLNRFGEKESAKKIIESLKENSSNNEDWGMYWIANKPGWYWYQAPIETQALLIEAFAEVTQDTKSVDAMKVWLLKNKQAKNWPTTRSTSEAIYALLLQGSDWLSVKDNTVIKLGDEKIMTKKLSENEKEAETGYIKLNWKAEEVKKEMASISVQNKSRIPGFGGVYWQYFEDLDKIKNNTGSVLSVSKELYLKKNTLKGDELQKITTENSLKIGDLVTVRLVITSKEDVEYIHLKDMRASCFEPVNVLSQYQYSRLGYYMSTKDAATHFFFDQINKGTYVLEYDIRVNNSGEFSNGITTIQSMYAPEFASHTKGIRVKVN
ncbi:carboxypeptidase-like regulatory domain-containing protein [Flavobacterium sp. SH_e]|uniref:alpha-2-macroglobulin family protein n=1 Tax=Flavobacterium sp. SH_e TaxID=2983767 RepID=UPI0021E40A91|nr:carboxypeptidase-like regulatory domain-containing protein [Flavobacterium sp. SH_e]MCV2483914.1 carboxypeptidase-like regulatory domain-containing protein [Flavobacterium sp. SH_e]